MADFYIHPTNGNNANSGATELLPKQFWSEVSMTAGNRFFPAREQHHPIGAYRFFLSGSVCRPYGVGAIPRIYKTVGPDAWMYIQQGSNVILEDLEVDGNGFTGTVLNQNVSAVNIANNIIRRCKVHGSTNGNNMRAAGDASFTCTNTRYEDCETYDAAIHGLLFSTAISNSIILRCISHGNGYGAAGHGISMWSPSASPTPTYNTVAFCESYENIDFDGIEGQGMQFDDNSQNNKFVGNYSHDNQGTGLTANSGAGHSFIGNLSIRNRAGGIRIVGSSTNCKIYHNTLVGNCTDGSITAEIDVTGASTGTLIRNNVLKKDGASLATTGISLSGGSVTSSVIANNAINGYTTPVSGLADTGTISADPLLDTDFSPLASSPLLAAGATIAALLRSFDGSTIWRNPPDIGALQRRVARTAMTRS